MSMVFSSPKLLLVKSKNLNMAQCIICRNINDCRRSKKFTSTDNGRRNMMEYSNTLQDLKHIKHHVDMCYLRYKRKSDRANEKKSDCSASTINSAVNEKQAQ